MYKVYDVRATKFENRSRKEGLRAAGCGGCAPRPRRRPRSEVSVCRGPSETLSDGCSSSDFTLCFSLHASFHSPIRITRTSRANSLQTSTRYAHCYGPSPFSPRVYSNSKVLTRNRLSQQSIKPRAPTRAPQSGGATDRSRKSCFMALHARLLVKVLDEAAETVARDETLALELEARRRRGVVGLEPLLDGAALVRMAVGLFCTGTGGDCLVQVARCVGRPVWREGRGP